MKQKNKNIGLIQIDVSDIRGNALGRIAINLFGIDKRAAKAADFFQTIHFEDGLSEAQLEEERKRLNGEIESWVDYVFGHQVSKVVFTCCDPLAKRKNGEFFFEEVFAKIAAAIPEAINTRIGLSLSIDAQMEPGGRN